MAKMKATVILRSDGPLTYSYPGLPKFVQGKPETFTDPRLIELSQLAPWLKVITEKSEEPEAEPVRQKAVATPMIPAAELKKSKPKPKTKPKKKTKSGK